MKPYIAKFSQTKKYYVYEYLRKNASKHGCANSPFYVGKGTNKRAYDQSRHFIKTPHVDRVKIVADSLAEADAFQLEMLLIYHYGRIDKKTGLLRNRTDGGDAPYNAIRSISSRQKQARSISGDKNHMFGKNHTSLTKQKISLATKGKKRKPHSEEHKRKISEARIGKRYPRNTNTTPNGR